MFSQNRGRNRQRARPSITASLFQGTSAAASNDIGGVFAASVSMSNSAQQLANSFFKPKPKPNTQLPSIEPTRNRLLVILQEGKKTLARGGKTMLLAKGEIKATPEQLAELENRLRQVKDWQGLKPLEREVHVALGYRVVAT